MAKTYRITYVIDDKQAIAAAQRSVNSAQAIATAQAQAVAKQAREAAKLDAIQDRLTRADYSRRVQYERRKADVADRSAKQATAAQAREAAKLDALQDRLIKRDYSRKVQFERRKVEETERAAKRTEEIAERDETLKRYALQAAALTGLVALATTYGQAATEAGERSRALTATFVSEREQLGEMATLLGRPNDNKFALEMARFNVTTGMRPGERNAFLTELLNSGAQYKGSRISEKEFGEFAKQSAALTTALGFDPGQTGNLAGTVLGFQDFSKFGDRASEEALGKLSSGFQILGHGKGAPGVMARQFAMLTSASLSEDAMRGTFTGEKGSDEAAIALSIAAEKHDAQAAELVKMATRGLRDFDDEKTGPLLAKAGIKPSTGFIAAIEQLAPVIEEEARATGDKTEDVLRKRFADVGTAEALAVFLNKGAYEGGFEERRQFAKGVQGPDVAMRTIGGFQEGEVFGNRQADALNDLEQAERGSKNTKLDIIRKHALSSLGRQGKIDTTGAIFKDYLVGAAGFGTLGSGEQVRIDEEAQRLIKKTTPKGAEAAPWSDLLNFTPTAREDDLNRAIGRSEAAGGDPMHDIAKILLEQNGLLREQNDLMKQDRGGPNGRAPAPLPGAPVGGPVRP